MRRFVLGLVVGAAGYVAVHALLGIRAPTVVPAASSVASTRLNGSAIAHETVAESRPDDRSGQPTSATDAADDAAIEKFCQDFLLRTTREAYAQKQAEPKDIGWAYATEELLRQFVAAHRRSASFRLTKVDCRTTYCQIEATGPADSMSAFSVVINEAQAGYEEYFGLNSEVGGGTGKSADGSHDFSATLYRNTDKDDALRGIVSRDK
jgi:hypothetical protein